MNVIRLFENEVPPFERLEIQPMFKAALKRLIEVISACTGHLRSMQIKPYLIYQQQYVRVLFVGDVGRFNLTINIAGHTQFPDFSAPRLRFYMAVVDEMEAYYLVDLLHNTLLSDPFSNDQLVSISPLSPISVHNTVDSWLGAGKC